MSQAEDSDRVVGSESEIYQELARMAERGEQGVLATVTATRLSVPRQAGTKMIVHAQGTVTGTIGGGAAEARVIRLAEDVLAAGECRMVDIDLAGGLGICGGAMEIFLEPVLRDYPFFVVGAGHVGQAVARLGATLGFRFTLIDDRPEFLAAAERIPGVNTVAAGPGDLAGRLTVPQRAAVLVCSRNHKLDAGYLEALLRLEKACGREFVFFGSLGSRSKAEKLRGVIGEMPDLAARMAQVRLPVGLELGADSPAEIALSVLAEALATLRGVAWTTGAEGGPACPLHGADAEAQS